MLAGDGTVYIIDDVMRETDSESTGPHAGLREAGGHRQVHIVWGLQFRSGSKVGVTDVGDGFTLGGMSMVFTLPDETAAQIEQLADARGVTPTAVLVEAVRRLVEHPDVDDDDPDDPEFQARLAASLVAEREILDRLAMT